MQRIDTADSSYSFKSCSTSGSEKVARIVKSFAFAHINVARAWEIAGRRLADVALAALTKNIEEVSIVELCYATQCSNDRAAGQCKNIKKEQGAVQATNLQGIPFSKEICSSS